MHVTAYPSTWNQAYADELLQAYAPSTQVEAIADVGAVRAILRLNSVDNDTLCSSVSQLWCARVGVLHDEWPAAEHPRANLRGDLACAFLRRHS